VRNAVHGRSSLAFCPNVEQIAAHISRFICDLLDEVLCCNDQGFMTASDERHFFFFFAVVKTNI
jgi:hypothetical protein